MENLEFIRGYLRQSLDIKSRLVSDHEVLTTIERTAELISSTIKNGNKIFIAGNGGSAADSQHIAAELVSRFFYDRPGLPAIALTTDTSILTAVGNDYGFERLFSRQIEALGSSNDMFIGISTSGNSKNILNAISTAKSMGLHTVGLSGIFGRLREISDIAICVPSDQTPHIQECHITVGHIMCALVEKTIYPQD